MRKDAGLLPVGARLCAPETQRKSVPLFGTASNTLCAALTRSDATLRKLCASTVNTNFAKCVFSRIPSVRYGRSSKKKTKINASSVTDPFCRLPKCAGKDSVMDDELRAVLRKAAVWREHDLSGRGRSDMRRSPRANCSKRAPSGEVNSAARG